MKNLYLFVLLILLAGSSIPATAQSPVHKQTTSNIILSNVDNISVTMPNISTAGDLIVVQVTWDKQNRTLTSLTDSRGNTYKQIGVETNWGTTYRSTLYYAYNISVSPAKITITANLDHKTQNLIEIYASEYSNIMATADPLDVSKTAFGNSGTTISSGSATTTTPNELLYGIAIGESNTISTGSGFNNRSMDNQNIVEDKLGVSAGSQSVSFTGNTNWIAQMATFKSVATPLPIELSYLTAKEMNNGKVELEWATATESNSDHFEIQRSRDGQSWASAGQIEAAGNSATTRDYSFIDETPYPGLSYYRLNQVDRDGKAVYSKVVTVHIAETTATAIKIYPNPAASYLVVEGAKDLISIFSTAGQRMLVRSVPDGETKTTVDLTSLPKGAYFVKAGEKSLVFLRQ